jgi:biopolymer transport protein ExbB/TolQ
MTALDLLLSDTARVLPIAAASLTGCFILLERFFALKNLRRDAQDLMVKLKSLSRSAEPAGVKAFLSNSEGRAAAVFGHGLGHADQDGHELARLTESAWADELDRMERPLTLCVVAAIVAFLAGLLPLLIDLLELAGWTDTSSLPIPSSAVRTSPGLPVAVTPTRPSALITR